MIGVGIPVWRGTAFVAETLESLLNQRGVRFKLFVSIDGADADSERACLPFASDPRVRIVVQPRRLGWVKNTAAVLAGASEQAEFVCVQPHDDWVASTCTSGCGTWTPTACSRSLNFPTMAGFNARTFHEGWRQGSRG